MLKRCGPSQSLALILTLYAAAGLCACIEAYTGERAKSSEPSLARSASKGIDNTSYVR